MTRFEVYKDSAGEFRFRLKRHTWSRTSWPSGRGCVWLGIGSWNGISSPPMVCRLSGGRRHTAWPRRRRHRRLRPGPQPASPRGGSLRRRRRDHPVSAGLASRSGRRRLGTRRGARLAASTRSALTRLHLPRPVQALCCQSQVGSAHQRAVAAATWGERAESPVTGGVARPVIAWTLQTGHGCSGNPCSSSIHR